jgi:alkanesulfonate monooxygenase SsuD/methylene tetrahydromethanopterin reductase-like flavin-dependent oxidoreductase (luciferase family)
MDIGASIFLTEYSISPTELGTALEERGSDSLWVVEHSHIPVTRRFNVPTGGELERQYYDVMDPFVTLSAVRRAIRYGDAIIPQASSAGSGAAEDFLPRFRQMAEEAGRDPKSLSVTLDGAPEDADRLKRYRDLGVVRMNVRLPPAKAGEILPVLDRWAKLIPQLQ